MTNENQTNEIEILRAQLADARRLSEEQADEIRALRELVEDRAQDVVLVRFERDAAIEDIRTARSLMSQQKAWSELARKLLDASVPRQPIEDLIEQLEENGGTMLADRLREAISRADNPREFLRLVG